MERFESRLLDVWRAACGHAKIGESTSAVAEMLAGVMPLDRLVIYSIDPTHPSLEPAATGTGAISGRKAVEAEPPAPPPAGIGLSTTQLKRVISWCRRNTVAQRSRAQSYPKALAEVIPEDGFGDMLIGPLLDHDHPEGLVVLTGEAGKRFRADHVRMCEILLEPFSISLVNHLRIEALSVLTQAAEADRRSLLTRLGRRELVDTIVGAESGLGSVMDRVELVAKSDVPVLIFGETGTGKELVARAIHSRSPRASGPVIRVNCGAIPSELIDSELFGHERGSFTGAIETRQGWFERANHGTLFMDEIGELPLAAQVRLLRVLQDGYLDRVGGAQPIKVDVRVVAATHCDLPLMVREGRFREDLWYRLAVFPIILPPLRERVQDIPALARHFAQRAATRFGLAPVMPTPEDDHLLISYDWPGNVRELAAVIDRAAILGDGHQLEVAKAIGISREDSRNSVSAPNPSEPGSAPLPGSQPLAPLDAAIRKHIEAALALSRGRIEGSDGAAAKLEVNPHTLRARMRKLAIDWTVFRPNRPA